LRKLQRDAAAHHTDAIDGVHQGFGLRNQNVAMCEFYHSAPILVVPIPLYNYRRLVRGVFDNTQYLIPFVSSNTPIRSISSHGNDPWEQELCLLAFFHKRVAPIQCRNRVPVQHVQVVRVMDEFSIPGTGITCANSPTSSILGCPMNHGVKIRLKMNYWSLTAWYMGARRDFLCTAGRA